MEEWKVIEGTNGDYEISSYGRLWSNITGKILKTHINSAGYMLSNIKIHGVKKRRQVHRMVAKAFIPNPENKPQVNHLDANRTNNRVDNLEWCTGSENTRYSFKIGTILVSVSTKL